MNRGGEGQGAGVPLAGVGTERRSCPAGLTHELERCYGHPARMTWVLRGGSVTILIGLVPLWKNPSQQYIYACLNLINVVMD